MADPSRVPDAGAGASRYPGTPRWVKVSGIFVLVLVVLLVVAMAASGGQHGPMRHMPSGDPGGNTVRTALAVPLQWL